ncbi:MAG: DUF4091 domain-containing protein [Kiritimatiellia bacterium]
MAGGDGGHNCWCQAQTRTLIAPHTCQDGNRWPGWAYGDTFVVYPRKDGPFDSMRREIFGESLQDYRLLQTLAIARDDRRLAALQSFQNFPKNPAWRLQAKPPYTAKPRNPPHAPARPLRL